MSISIRGYLEAACEMFRFRCPKVFVMILMSRSLLFEYEFVLVNVNIIHLIWLRINLSRGIAFWNELGFHYFLHCFTDS